LERPNSTGAAPPGESPPPQARRKTSFLRCCLITGCALVLITGIVGIVVGVKAFSWFREGTEPDVADRTLSEIVPSTPPRGYTVVFGNSIDSWFIPIRRVAWIAKPGDFQPGRMQPGSPPTMITVFCLKEKQPEEALKAQYSQFSSGQGIVVATVESTQRETVTIRGKPMEIDRALVLDARGNRVIQYAILLEQAPTPSNPAGQELLVIAGGERTFDRKAMDAFLSSIR
jgi:hypothetical protein